MPSSEVSRPFLQLSYINFYLFRQTNEIASNNYYTGAVEHFQKGDGDRSRNSLSA